MDKMLVNKWVTNCIEVNKNFKIPANPAFKIMPASNVLISEETSTCTANSQK